MALLSKLFWVWCVCGLLNAFAIGYDMFDGTYEETMKDLDRESKDAFDLIGGKPGVILAAFLFGPILTYNLLFKRGDK